MTDRELLELACKAGGYERTDHGEGGIIIQDEHCHSVRWNPLTDDGDALRLAVKLNLFEPELIEDWKWCRNKKDLADVCASYRRAIVRAAAEIGRSME